MESRCTTIDVEAETLTTLRDLRLKHRPSLHTATPVSHDLGDITIAPKTGEFVHPGEREAWKEMKHRLQEQARLEAERREQILQALQAQATTAQTLKEKAMRLALAVPPPQPTTPTGMISRSLSYSTEEHRPPIPRSLSNQKGTCEICGSLTSDWYSFNGKTKTCRCNACLRNGRIP